MSQSRNLHDELEEIRDRLNQIGDAIAEEAHIIDLQTGYLQETGDFKGTLALLKQVEKLKDITALLEQVHPWLICPACDCSRIRPLDEEADQTIIANLPEDANDYGQCLACETILYVTAEGTYPYDTRSPR